MKPTVITPGCRLLLAFAWCEDGFSGHSLLPVVAVEVVPAPRLKRKGKASGDAPAAPSYRPLVCCPATGKIVRADELADHDNVASHLIACPWPPERDEAESADLVSHLKRQALERAGGRTVANGRAPANA